MDVQVLLGLLIAKFRVGKGEKREKGDNEHRCYRRNDDHKTTTRKTTSRDDGVGISADITARVLYIVSWRGGYISFRKTHV